jgi:hypothetical protein
LRSYHYLRDRAVWQDEAGLLLTVMGRGYGDLFRGRLDYHQAAPPLYLCVLKAVSQTLGESSHSLRLPSFLASCAALILFVPVARRLLAPEAVPWAVLLFACSEQLLWHASEAKAYSIDVLAAVVLLAVLCFDRFASLARQLLVYALLAPLLLLSSYPACFLCAGLLLAYLPVVYNRKQLRTWLAYSFLAAMTGLTLLWVVLGPARSQHDAEIHSCWVACMPCWERPWTVLRWLVVSPFEIGRYCCKPVGQALTVLAVPGAIMLWRHGRRTVELMMVLPLALNLAAAFLHRYPFGGARITVYAAPAVLLLGAAGVPPVRVWLGTRSQLLGVGLAILLALPLASSLWQVVYPWREADIPAAEAYVRCQRHPGELVLGNDVAQQYYFRRLGSSFHLLDGSPMPSPQSERLWVVMTVALPRAERVRMASHLAPRGWHLLQEREFPYTTVLLFARPHRSGSCQSMGVSPSSSRALLTAENGLLPKNFLADNGEGCAPATIR